MPLQRLDSLHRAKVEESVTRLVARHGELTKRLVAERDAARAMACALAETLVERFDRRGTEPFELYRARSRLYRNEILQENTRWKALAEIFTMHSFALL